ncbi:MAG TPA: hypothetical protein PK735_05610 [Flavobacteriales bacterium]|nr:hypothetical protein [Flavobacteriales bacterium]
MLKPPAEDEAEPSKFIDSPGQILTGAASLMEATAVGGKQGMKQVIVAANDPVPMLFDVNSNVRQPVGFA